MKSNLDATYRLDHRTDESISFTDDDLIVIQNKRGTACSITLEAIRLPDGRRAVLKPSRQSTIALTDKEVSELRSRVEITLGGEEALILHSSEWKAKLTGHPGRVMLV